jgi:hypothetical protein
VSTDLIITWRPRRLVLITFCAACDQQMPADHRTHINDEAAPVAPGAAPDPQKEIHS